VIRTLEPSGKGKTKVAGAKRAVVVEQPKVRDCLVSDTHSVGRYKARVFPAPGFCPDDPEPYVSELLRIVRDGELRQREDSPFGTKLLEWGQRSVRSVRS